MQVSLCTDVSLTPENVVGTAGFFFFLGTNKGDVSWGMGRHQSKRKAENWKPSVNGLLVAPCVAGSIFFSFLSYSHTVNKGKSWASSRSNSIFMTFSNFPQLPSVVFVRLRIFFFITDCWPFLLLLIPLSQRVKTRTRSFSLPPNVLSLPTWVLARY